MKKRTSLCNDDSKNDDKTIERMMMKLMIIRTAFCRYGTKNFWKDNWPKKTKESSKYMH